jgi:hypothetical protein
MKLLVFTMFDVKQKAASLSEGSFFANLIIRI